MASVRRTVSLTPDVARRLDEAAANRGLSFSAFVAELAGAGMDRIELPFAGIIDDDDDLSTRVDEVLARLAN